MSRSESPLPIEECGVHFRRRSHAETSVQGNEGQNKDCPCFQYIDDSLPYQPFSDQDLANQQAFLAQLVDLTTSVATSTTSSSAPTSTGALTCSSNSVNFIPAKIIETSGDVTPNQLLYTLRQVLCTNGCGEPADVPSGVAWSMGSKTAGDCELAVSVAENVEAVSQIKALVQILVDRSSTCIEALHPKGISGNNAGTLHRISLRLV